MELITDVDYSHARRVFKNLDNKNLGDSHHMYVKSDTLLLADVFENFRNKCIEIYELDPVQVLSVPRFMYSVFKCKQFVWMGNVSKTTCR